MKVVICGAGDVGRHLAKVLSAEGHGVTVIDTSAGALQSFEDLADVRMIQGSSTHALIQREAGVPRCDLVVAATDQDEINLLTAVIAKQTGAKRVIARIHHKAYIDRSVLDYAQNLQIDHLICPEHLTAMVIARTLSNPGAMVIDRFAGGGIEMQQYAVSEGCRAVGMSLRDLSLPRGVRLSTIERGNRAFIPQAGSVLEPDDIVSVIGETRHFEAVRVLMDERKRQTRNVVIMGGSAMAVWLSRALGGRDFSVRLFETTRARAEELSAKLSHVTVLQADPTDPTVFQEEHLEDCDAFVAVSHEDEHNILGALQAKSMGAATAVVVITHPTYLQLLEHVGIDHPYSPRIEAAKEVVRLMDPSPVKRLATISAGIAEVYGLQAGGGGAAVDQPLRQIKLPQGAFLAAVQRGDAVRVPGADDSVRDGDGLIVIGPSKIARQLRDLFVGK